jgi:hypothetical protein
MAKRAFATGLGALMVIASIVGAHADEILIPNSTSPDGRYALFAIDSKEEGLPATLEIRSLKDQKTIIKLDGGGWVMRASAYDYGDEDTNSIFVIWNPTGSRVAMMIKDGKRSGSLVVCERAGNSFQQNSKLPDFSAVAVRTLGLKEDGRYNYEFPQAWISQNKLLIKMRFDDVSLADSNPYQFECTLEFDVASGKTSNFKVLSKTPEEG